jgi:hypothetical protein
MPDIFNEATQPSPTLSTNPQSTPTITTTPTTTPVHALSSFTHYPHGIRFNQQEENEEVILFLRRHIITNIPWLIATLVLTALPILLTYMLQTINLSLTFLSTQFLFIVLAFYYLIVLGYAFANFINWFYNIGIVTNKRVMDIDFANLSSLNVAATSITDIADVSYNQKGFAQQLYNYGDVILQTETKTQNFVFEKAPKPAQAVNIISQLIGGDHS